MTTETCIYKHLLGLCVCMYYKQVVLSTVISSCGHAREGVASAVKKRHALMWKA